MDNLEILSNSFEKWLDDICLAEERQEIVSNLRDKMSRTLGRIQIEGMVPILDFAQIRHVAESWLELIELLTCMTSSSPTTTTEQHQRRRRAIKLALVLYEFGQFSLDLFTDVIIYIKL